MVPTRLGYWQFTQCGWGGGGFFAGPAGAAFGWGYLFVLLLRPFCEVLEYIVRFVLRFGVIVDLRA